MSWCLLFVFLSGVAGETLRMLGVRDVIVNPPALEQGLVTAMQLAVDDVNQELASSNSDFDFVLDFVSLPNSTYAEDPSHPAEVLDGVLSSIQEDGAVIVVGSLSTGSALLLSYLLSTRMSFPLIAYGADYGRSSLKPEDDYMFRVKPIGQEQMQALIGLLLDMAATRHPLHRAGYAVERIGVLYEAGQDGEAGLLALIEAINEVGRGEIEIVRSMPLPPPSSTEEEFQRSLVDMSNSGARIMVVVEHGDTVLAPTLSAASGLNMTTAEYAWYVTDSGAYDGALGIDDNPTLARDLVGLMAVRPCPSAAASAAFTERWKSLLGPVDAFGEVDPMLMYAYDAVRAAASAIESVRAQGPLLPYQPAFALDEPWVDGKRVKESLEELRIEVSTGSLSFTLGDRDLASQSMCAYNLQRHPKLGAGFVRALEWAPSSGGQWFSSFPASSVALMGNSEIYPSDRPTTRGQHMKVGVINCDGFVNQNSDGSFRGASIDLIEQIAEELGFTYELLDYNNVVSFNAFVDAVQSGELNLGASCITITAPRMETASFSVPFWDLGVSFILKPGGASTSAVWRAFMPFTLWVWVGILMAVICSAILLFMLESSVNDDFYFPPTAFKSMMKSLYVTGCVLFQHLAHKPETMAGYVLTTGWMFFTFLIGR
jgi:ABC-type amino acid transport substrate-binding protein